MNECIFCRIVAGEAPAEVVYEDEAALAFMDVSPWSRGHLLVIPKRHARNLFDLPEEDGAAVMRAAIRIAPMLKRASNAAGLNLWQANERSAGQTVFHFHLHLLPRYVDDGIGLRISPRRAGGEELRQMAERIRAEIGRDDLDAGGFV